MSDYDEYKELVDRLLSTMPPCVDDERPVRKDVMSLKDLDDLLNEISDPSIECVLDGIKALYELSNYNPDKK